MHVTTMTGYLLSGTITAEVAWQFPVLVPVVVASALLGAWAYHRLGDLGFQRIVLGLLAASGVMLLAASLPKLLAA
jgi:chromate transport protein ChrA